MIIWIQVEVQGTHPLFVTVLKQRIYSSDVEGEYLRGFPVLWFCEQLVLTTGANICRRSVSHLVLDLH